MAEACGTILNARFLAETVRGRVVPGVGTTLFEQDERGQMLNASMADRRVPMAAVMPYIAVVDTVSSTIETELAVNDAVSAVAIAINNALSPFGVTISEIPLTPLVILRELGEISDPGCQVDGKGYADFVFSNDLVKNRCACREIT